MRQDRFKRNGGVYKCQTFGTLHSFMGLPPTGKSITMTGIEIFRIENGKIAELWGEANLLGLMQQLGILPSLGP
jgi:predicted ester cyclase